MCEPRLVLACVICSSKMNYCQSLIYILNDSKLRTSFLGDIFGGKKGVPLTRALGEISPSGFQSMIFFPRLIIDFPIFHALVILNSDEDCIKTAAWAWVIVTGLRAAW